jgi:hypothetical protein
MMEDLDNPEKDGGWWRINLLINHYCRALPKGVPWLLGTCILSQIIATVCPRMAIIILFDHARFPSIHAGQPGMDTWALMAGSDVHGGDHVVPQASTELPTSQKGSIAPLIGFIFVLSHLLIIV